MNINTLDGLVLVIIGFNLILGAIRGAAWQILRIASIVLGIWAAVHWGEAFLEAFKERVSFTSSYGIIVARVALFFTVYILMYGVTQIVRKIIDKVKLGSIDRTAGAACGAFKGAAFACMMLYLQYIPPVNQFEIVENQLYGTPPGRTDYSRSNFVFLKYVKPWLDERVPDDLKQRLNDCCERIPEFNGSK